MENRRTPAENAQLALLLEVAGTPKPGNVDRDRDMPDLRFEHFLAGAVGAGRGLRLAEGGESVGRSFERAVAGMALQEGGNTQFGALLLIVPLVRAAADGTDEPSAATPSLEESDEASSPGVVVEAPTPEAVTRIVESTTIEDAAAFYRAFEHVDVFVEDPPEGVPDVREGADATDAVESGEMNLYEVIAAGAERDDVAREWTSGFERSFDAADRIEARNGPLSARAAAVYLELLSERPDTLVAKRRGERTAQRVMTRAQAAREDGPELIDAFAERLIEEGINPGTTADVVAAGLFIALCRSAEV